ncbi:MAG: uracil phosphoribosyltransferase [Opitutaceae bacterium]
MALTVLNHPVAKHLLTRLRDRTTDAATFRALCHRLTTFLVIEATRDLETCPDQVETPLESFEGSALARELVVVPILRAGLGMLHTVTDLFPKVAVGYVGLERDHQTAEARSYYCKLPPLEGRCVLVVDPMLATGGSAEQAIALLKDAGGNDVRLIAMVAAPEGVARVEASFPEVAIFTAGLDRGLDERKYIRPGLGDFGDRLYGT